MSSNYFCLLNINYANVPLGIFVPRTTERGKDLINLEYVPIEPHKLAALSHLQSATNFCCNMNEHLYNVSQQLNGINPFFQGYAEMQTISDEQKQSLENSKKFLEDLLSNLQPN